MRCPTHDLSVAPDGLCIVCRRDLERAPRPSVPPSARGSAGPVVALGCAFVGIATFVALRSLSPVAAAETAKKPSAVHAPGTLAAPRVTVFTTSWCGSCKAAKAWLRKNDVAFEEADIEQSSSARERYQAITRRNVVPVIEIGETVLEGFDPGDVRRALDSR